MSKTINVESTNISKSGGGKISEKEKITLQVNNEIADATRIKTDKGKDVEVIPFEFSGMTTTIDKFRLHDFLIKNHAKLSVAYKMITDSLAMNKLKKRGVVQKVDLFKDFDLIIIPSMKPVDGIKNAVTYNRAMALAVAIVRYNLTGKRYDWDNHVYITKDVKEKFVPPADCGNKIALSMGLQQEHDLYWFVAAGFEQTFDMYPVEALGVALFRLAYKDSLRLSKMDDIDIMKTVLAQMSKRGNIEEVFNKLGPSNIASTINDLASSRKDVAEIRFSKIKELFSKMSSLLEHKDQMSYKF
nr:nucleoprotein [Alfalfa ringspot-associated virus]WCR76265.1 nucleoprotein [Alfalfa ringspot-associated virus]WCR76266.1 nucleoprotein [Alfalfa ringspot-associated virus]